MNFEQRATMRRKLDIVERHCISPSQLLCSSIPAAFFIIIQSISISSNRIGLKGKSGRQKTTSSRIHVSFQSLQQSFSPSETLLLRRGRKERWRI